MGPCVSLSPCVEYGQDFVFGYPPVPSAIYSVMVYWAAYRGPGRMPGTPTTRAVVRKLTLVQLTPGRVEVDGQLSSAAGER